MGATEPELLQRARAVGFDKDVGLRRKLEQNFYRFRPLEIEHEAALVAVERHEADAFAIADWRRRPAHIAFRRLDFDNIRPHVGKQRSAQRTGDEIGQLDNLDAGERLCH